ncbi:MAG: methylmalonyl-CoA mutase [Rhizobiales bacterium]|nr:methylmalonyl-CoA mutase [Hyphomicrobiales bacterium]
MDVGPEQGGPEFPPVGHEQWLEIAEKALGGVPVEQALTSLTDDGIEIHALMPREAAEPIARGHAGPNWTIVQRVDDPDVARARRQVSEDVAGGATGLSLVFAGAANAFGHGLPATQAALDAVLADVPAERVHLRIDAHPHSRSTAEFLAALIAQKRGDITRLSLSFGIDPATILAGCGGLRMSIAALEASMPQSLGHFFAAGAPGILLEADGRAFHNAGATEAQELGAMVASAALYLRMFSAARQPLVYAVPHIGFSLSVDQDQFLSIAKLRAVRLLWAKLQESCGVEPCAATIHAETSYRMMTRRDPETNILRNTIAAFAAATGGADTVCVLPHTIAHGLPDGFARRVARNLQLVMARESHVGFVTDPAAGSGMVGELTGRLCAAAWEEFRRIEAEGGILRSLSGGHVQARIAEATQKRAEAFRAGERHVIGTTLFALLEERPVTVLKAESPSAVLDVAETCAPLIAKRIDELLDAAS